MVLKRSRRTIKQIVIHCAATPEGKEFTARDIDRMHRQRGWNQIGYNYVIKLDGTIESGRDVDLIPAQVAGHNSDSIGVVYIGGVDRLNRPKDTRTAKQKETLISLLKDLKRLYPTAEILGHRDFPGVAKACPCFDAKKEYKSI